MDEARGVTEVMAGVKRVNQGTRGVREAMGRDRESMDGGGGRVEDLLEVPDGVGQGDEGEHDVNLKTRQKRTHSGTFIFKEIKTETNNVQRLVERYEGWEKESGVSGTSLNSRELLGLGRLRARIKLDLL